MKPRTIAAVVVTYNRKYLLTECLKAVRAQTLPVDKIFVVDNASTDGTKDTLVADGYLSGTLVQYIRLPVNTGGAGGFYEGISSATKAGFDWIWVMDDDAAPAEDALEIASQHFDQSVSAVASLKVGVDNLPQYSHHGWITVRGLTDRVVRCVTPKDLSKSTVVVGFSSFVGLAINRLAVERVGGPKREFFIHNDDLEYCQRLSQFGPLILVPKSVIMHKSAVNQEIRLTHFTILGKRVTLIPFNKLWITYFKHRNLIYLKSQDSIIDAALYAAIWYALKCAKILLLCDHKALRMWFYLNAVSDGIRGNFDNGKPRRLTTAAGKVREASQRR